MKNYMIGTKFFRYDISTSMIEIIRLKKILSEGRYLFDTGYRDQIFDPIEFTYLYLNCHAIDRVGRVRYSYTYHDIHGNKQTQFWTLLHQGEKWHKFRVENRGIILTDYELENYYTKLVPDGFAVSGILNYRVHGYKCKDVLLTIHKDNDPMPSIVCRQDINSPYYEEGTFHVGASISANKFPNLDFQQLVACDSMNQVKNISIYAEDTVSTILHYLHPLKKYDTVLNRIADNTDKRNQGICRSMYELLNTTKFYADFADLYGIGLYPMPLSFNRDTMTHEEETMFNGLFALDGIRYTDLHYKPYTKDVDLSDENIMPIRIANMTGQTVIDDLFVVTTGQS